MPANLTGKEENIDARLLMRRNIKYMRPDPFLYLAKPGAFSEVAQAVLGYLAEGKLKVHVHKVSRRKCQATSAGCSECCLHHLERSTAVGMRIRQISHG